MLYILQNTCTRGRRASFLILPMMGAWRPKHVDWLCRNKTCTVLHKVGVLFDLYYDARKHNRKIKGVLFASYIVQVTAFSMWCIYVTASSRAAGWRSCRNTWPVEQSCRVVPLADCASICLSAMCVCVCVCSRTFVLAHVFFGSCSAKHKDTFSFTIYLLLRLAFHICFLHRSHRTRTENFTFFFFTFVPCVLIILKFYLFTNWRTIDLSQKQH